MSICLINEALCHEGPPLWSSGQNSWLQNGDVLFPVRYELKFKYVMQKKVDSLCGLVGLERGPLNLVSAMSYLK
jgi:hypothetical protein